MPGGSSLAAQLRRWRERALLTQEQLARATGLGVRTIRRLESAGDRRPRSESIRLLAEALKLTDDEKAQLVEAMQVEATPSPRATVPRQLPPDVTGFSGRTDQLAELDRLLADSSSTAPAVVISAIAGTAGVGKTALALRWAHRRAGRFPDGQLYVNLRGFHPGIEPTEPTVAVTGFLESLGVARQRIPLELDAQVALYRSLLAGKRMLVVLDNAHNAEQVRPLLPAAPGTMALVTSRNQLTGLVAAEGARPLMLDLLSVLEAHELLVRRLGNDRVAAEPGAVAEIIALCARLPLALAVTAARASTDPQLTLAAIAGDLRDSRQRLSTFDTGDSATDVRAVFSSSYRHLSDESAELFRLLGLHPGPDISLPAAASMAGLPPASVRPLLGELVRANLIAQHAPERYMMHDLFRLYAADQAQAHDSAQARRAAMRRMVDHYLHSAFAADRLLYPGRDSIHVDHPASGVTVEVHDSPRQAMKWLADEHISLLVVLHCAVGCGFDRRGWQLAWALSAFLERRGYWRECMDTQAIAMDAAERLGDTHMQAVATRALGRVHTRLSGYQAADDLLRQAIELTERHGDTVTAAHCHVDLASLLALQRHFVTAIDHCRTALDLYRTARHMSGQAAALNSIGWYLTLLGDHAGALVHCGQALALFEELGHPGFLAATLDSLGYAHHQLGHHELADSFFQRALKLVRELGDRRVVAQILLHSGDAQLARGKSELAREAWLEALGILTELDHPDADQVRARLAGDQSRSLG